jgi:hypothetical protein
MLTTKPSDNDRSKAPSRSGHGAASVIPHLNDEASRPRGGNAEGAAVENPESEAEFEPAPAVPLRPDPAR